MKTEFNLQAKSTKNHNIIECSLKIVLKKSNYSLKLDCNNGVVLKSNHEYPFMALKEIRKSLEKLDLLLMCNGSRFDVYPSGMSAISSEAYVLKLGVQATKLVNIFNESKINIDTVQRQFEYRKKWISSLGN